MAEYIEREKLIAELNNIAIDLLKDNSIQCSLAAGTVVDIKDNVVAKQPAADVVEIVRCKDCEHCCISTDPKTNISIQKCGYVGFNPIQSSQVSDDFYCGYGELKERKDGAKNG